MPRRAGSCLSSQTLGHASSFIMKSRVPFIAPAGLSCEVQVAAGASRLAHPAKVANRGRRGLPVLRRPAHGCITLQENAQRLSKRPHAPDRRAKTTSQLHCCKARRASPFSRYQSTGSVRASVGQLALPASVCFAIQIQSKVASPRAWPNPSFKRTCLRHAA